ncbi:hypothetical protein AB0M29_11095 [Streptomyces sp. NPDC051976]|uniref:hypothetical protein n=1 Tax=Streptomyces sp. NPDC051976 TaxID=3154947 RepID=UPI00342EED98
MSSHAAPHFAKTAECALPLTRSADPTDRRYLANRMVIDHATARAYLRRTSESLRDAAKELDHPLGFQRFLATLTGQEGPPARPRHPSRAVTTADHASRESPPPTSRRNALNHPAHISDAGRAE